MLTEHMKHWLKKLYIIEADNHLSIAQHEHLCSLGSPNREVAEIHETSSKEHMEFADILKLMAENL